MTGTVLTFILDNGAFAVAYGTLLLHLHHTKHRLLGLGYHTATVAVRASLRLCSVGSAAAVAVGTNHLLLNLNLLGDARGNLLQAEANAYPEVSALIDALAPLAATAKSTETAEAAKSAPAAKDVAKHAEDVVKVHASGAVASAAAHAVETLVAEAVIHLTLLGVAQYVVSLSSLLELFLSLFVAGIAVGVIFQRNFLVRLLEVVIRDILVNAQYLVVISLSSHYLISFFSDKTCHVQRLLSHGNLGKAYNLFIEHVAVLYTVNNLALLVVGRGHKGNSLMEVCAEIFAHHIHFF